ncbi:hypothetical protein PV327_001649 [Microctonus hyperodae]|uniref:Globin domain-containing protein n=1 Tax=Microctonus hyperodae TaxID=165561 RepID=A0AA39KNH7_MICHY|nr:hypothetical protein PV327_001649 [Microctonus hyperodae]
MNNLVLREDYNEDYVFVESTSANNNEQNVKSVKEDVPFHSFMPVDRTHDKWPKKEVTENLYDTTTKFNEINESNENQFFEKLKRKFKEHHFTVSIEKVDYCSWLSCCCTFKKPEIMGGVVSYLFLNSSKENIVDPKTGLSRKQMKLMKQTWDEFIRPNFLGVGVKAMLRLFAVHPEVKNIFPDFKDIPQCELANNKKFHAHCQMIMSTVNIAVDAFLANDIELFAAILKMTGERHAKRAMGKLNSEYFEVNNYAK